MGVFAIKFITFLHFFEKVPKIFFILLVLSLPIETTNFGVNLKTLKQVKVPKTAHTTTSSPRKWSSGVKGR